MPPGIARDEEIRDLIAGIPSVAAAWLFGSVARDEATLGSDLDVAVLTSHDAPDDVEGSLRWLALKLERFAPSGRVDIVVLGRQGPVFRHRVLNEGRLVLDRDPDRRIEFEGRTIAEYLDWKPTHDIAMRNALGGLRDRFDRGAA